VSKAVYLDDLITSPAPVTITINAASPAVSVAGSCEEKWKDNEVFEKHESDSDLDIDEIIQFLEDDALRDYAAHG
jgi:hypothetical protein